MADEAKKLHRIKFYTAWAKWIIEFIGSTIQYFSSNPVPKKSDYEE